MKTYKFWNPELVGSCIRNSEHVSDDFDPHTCSVEELMFIEDRIGSVASTTIKLNDLAQAEAVAELLVNEWNGEPRFEEVFI